MQITDPQLRHYQDEGYLFIPEYFSEEDIQVMKQEASLLAERDLPGMVYEKNTRLVRALQGCHLFSPTFDCLTRLSKMLVPAEQIVEGKLYVYQFKINFKMAFGGDIWKWHQDYIYWLEEDGMERPSCTNVLIFLDDVNEFNGPLLVIPRSHHRGVIRTEASSDGKGGWKESFGADLKYSLTKDAIAKLVKESQIVAPKGPKGSILFFHPNLVHGSAPNISPFDRTVLIITYNHIHNVPVPKGEPRPEFIVGRNSVPLMPIAKNSVLASISAK
jgi:ectoine hydroxylase